jgi:integrase
METLSRRLHAAQEAAGTPRWTWHALRRLAVDIMARRGIDIATAAAITGHTPTVMLEHYRRVSAADLRRAAAELGGQVLPFNPRGRESS